MLAAVRPLAAEDVRSATPSAACWPRTSTSALDVPPFDSSAMDGFAVVAGPAGELRVVGESRAGHPAGARSEPGTAMRISTGAALPDGRRRRGAGRADRGARRHACACRDRGGGQHAPRRRGRAPRRPRAPRRHRARAGGARRARLARPCRGAAARPAAGGAARDRRRAGRARASRSGRAGSAARTPTRWPRRSSARADALVEPRDGARTTGEPHARGAGAGARRRPTWCASRAACRSGRTTT